MFMTYLRLRCLGGQGIAAPHETWQLFQASGNLRHCLAAFQGVDYWRAERDICRRLSGHAGSLPGPCISADEVHAASQSKSFDYRVRRCEAPSLCASALPDATAEPYAGLEQIIRTPARSRLNVRTEASSCTAWRLSCVHGLQSGKSPCRAPCAF